MNSTDVIVPCYGYARFLEECIESVLSQSLSDVRVLIIDDASPDNTWEIAGALARRDARVRLSRHDENRGHIATYNEGLAWASAEYCLILSADDYLLPGALERATSLLDAHPDVGLVYGKALELHDNDALPPPKIPETFPAARARILAGRDFIASCGARNVVPTPTAIVRTEVQRQVGSYSHRLPHSGDMEMWLRIAAHASIAALDAYQAVYRQHGGNMSLRYYANNCLPDLEHRKAAIDDFFAGCGACLDSARRLHDRILRSLAHEAIAFASAAFNDASLEVCDELLRFALHVHPSAAVSLPWAKLAAKRRLGLRAWRAWQAARARATLAR